MVYEPTPEQIARAEEKRLQRREKKVSSKQDQETRPHLFLARPWISIQPEQDRHHTNTVTVMTWNLLAQSLIRTSDRCIRLSPFTGMAQWIAGSDLFPTSGKARKASERIPMLRAEILSHDADILCMQEVDGLDKLLPTLDLAGYAYSYASGAGKSHGCLIAYKNTMFRSIHETTIEYDKLETKNIANIVALQKLDPDAQVQGYIIATTHLFWHPAYTYERARQAGLLVREVIAFRELCQPRVSGWPSVLAGDFNFPPDDPAYLLLVGEPLSIEQQEHLRVSRVVHVSIDPTVLISVTKETGEGSNEEEFDPDRAIQNSRNPIPSDGLLSNTELSDLVGHYYLRSAYDEGQRTSISEGNNMATYGSGKCLPADKVGACEPMWTSFTYYWKTTLDYIFVLDAPGSRTRVAGYRQPHRTQDVERGLPQIGICGSDHFSLCAQLVTLPAILQ